MLTPRVSLSATVFLLFSSTLLSTHIHLLMHNASTVEWYGFQRMRQRERLLLGEMFPPCMGGPCGDRRDHPFGEYHETGAFVPLLLYLSLISLLHRQQGQRRRVEQLVLSPQCVGVQGQEAYSQNMGCRMGSDRKRG